jgi:hypothetical protein
LAAIIMGLPLQTRRTMMSRIPTVDADTASGSALLDAPSRRAA